MLNFSPAAWRRFRHDGDDGDSSDLDPGRQRRGGGFRSIGDVLAPVLARCGVPAAPPPDPRPDPQPCGLDHVAAARLLGEGIVRGDITPLRRLLDGASPAAVSDFLTRLAAGDLELSAAEAAARWRVTGDAADLDAAIAAAWAAFPRRAASIAPEGDAE